MPQRGVAAAMADATQGSGQVLVVGAGPVGLTAAIALTRNGVRCRLIDRNESRTDKSKALVLWSRTLELLDGLGGAARFLDAPDRQILWMLVGTYVWVDNLLYAEALAKRGQSGYGERYFEAFEVRAGPILKDRLSQAATDSASYWYTAWTNAGRPDLK